MNITFKTNKLRKAFNSEDNLQRMYGPVTAEKIKLRMAVLNAAPTLDDVSYKPPERRHKLTGKMKDSFAVNLDGGNRLVFKPDQTKSSDLRDITSITILSVGDYH